MSNPQNKLKFQAVLDALETKRTKKKSDTLKTKRTYAEEMRKASPQNDILRFGKKQKEFRDLGRKETVVTGVNEDDDEVKSIQYLPRPGAELFRKQEEAYGDSLKLAGLAQQYGRKTPDVRKIDSNQKEIEEERTRIAREKYKQLTTQKLPLRPGSDGTYSQVTDREKMNMANDIANEELVKKYGKGILTLLTALKNR